MCDSFAVFVSVSISYQLHDHSYINIYIFILYEYIHVYFIVYRFAEFFLPSWRRWRYQWFCSDQFFPGLQMWSQRFLGAEFMWMVGLSCLGALGCGLPPLLPRFPMLMMMPSIFKRKDATKLPQEIHLSHNELTTGCLEVLIVMWCNVNSIQKWRNAHFFDIFLVLMEN